MTINSSLYDSATIEMFLLEDVSLQGRKGDLRLLLKWLNLARNGQTKTVLITGDPGIGKSALLGTFVDIAQKGQLCRVLDFRDLILDTPEKLYVSFIDKLLIESDQILNETVALVAEATPTLNLNWTRDDLLESISLVKLQEGSDEKNMLHLQEQLIKKLKSSLPTLKKLKHSVQTELEQLVDILIDPWVSVAASLLMPLNPQIKKAIHVAQVIKQETETEESPLAKAFNAILSEDVQSTVEESTGEQYAREMGYIQALPATPRKSTENGDDLDDYDPKDSVRPVRTIEELTRHLGKVLQFVNKTIRNMDSAVLIVFDDWDQLLVLPEAQRESIKNMMVSIFKETAEHKTYRMMLCLASRSEGESYTLGGNLYNLFQNKILLSGLQDNSRTKLFVEPLKQVGVDVDPVVQETIDSMVKGNPFWLIKMRQYLKAWAQTTNVACLTPEMFTELGIETLNDLMEYNFCRIKLVFLYEEDIFHKIVAELVKLVGARPFSVAEVIERMRYFPDLNENLVFEALRSLYNHDFLVEDSWHLSATGDPLYHFQSRLIVEFLREKTAQIQEEVSSDEKVNYLKQIIPLSLKTGELDRTKTQELIAMNKAIGTDEMTTFLENTFLEHLEDPNPAVRIAAINNISALPSERTVERMLYAMADKDASVREHSIRNLGYLIEHFGIGFGAGSLGLSNQITDVLMAAATDSSEGVRKEVYTVLGKLSWNQELLPVLAKGLNDSSDAVRLKAIQALIEMEHPTHPVRDSFIVALEDTSLEVRKYACKGLERFINPDHDGTLTDILSRKLKDEKEPVVRSAAAETLAHSRDQRVLHLLSAALQNDPNEDVRITIARTLGKWNNWPIDAVETVILDVLRQPIMQAPAVLWSCIRSLGIVGESYQALDVLNELKRALTNEIVLMTIEVSLRKIANRLQKYQHRHEPQRSERESSMPEKNMAEKNMSDDASPSPSLLMLGDPFEENELDPLSYGASEEESALVN